jgi:hypothetical protein
MLCPECGFSLDPVNESHLVCPACGADPTILTADAPEFVCLHDGTRAEPSIVLAEMLGDDARPCVDVDYFPDPDLEALIAEGEALRDALREAPVLTGGNNLVN